MTVIIGYKKQEAGTNFVLFSRSRYMIGKFMTIYFAKTNQDFGIYYK